MRFQEGQRYKENEVVAVVIRPEYLPQTKDILEREFAFEGNQNPPERPRKQRLWSCIQF